MQSNRKIRLYTDFEYRAGSTKNDLVPIVLAQTEELSENERLNKHHNRAACFELVPTIGQSDWVILPDNWPVYVKQGKIDRAKEFSQIAAENDRLILVWSGGDPEWIVPISNAIQIQEGLHRCIGRQVAFAFERPSFVEDYIITYYSGEWQPIPKQEKPLVGFCGQGRARLKTCLFFYITNFLATQKYRLGCSPIVPVFHGFPTGLRSRVLENLATRSNIRTNFIIRDRYWAGAHFPKNSNRDRTSLRKGFVDNIMSSMYIVCVRGGGNFSKRLYETLACGRIPILIDTNSVLPYENFIPWESYIVRVDYRDLDHLEEKLLDFHTRFSASEFEDLQASCRRLWQEMLEVRGYYQNFYKYLEVTGIIKEH